MPPASTLNQVLARFHHGWRNSPVGVEATIAQRMLSSAAGAWYVGHVGDGDPWSARLMRSLLVRCAGEACVWGIASQGLLCLRGDMPWHAVPCHLVLEYFNLIFWMQALPWQIYFRSDTKLPSIFYKIIKLVCVQWTHGDREIHYLFQVPWYDSSMYWKPSTISTFTKYYS